MEILMCLARGRARWTIRAVLVIFLAGIGWRVQAASFESAVASLEGWRWGDDEAPIRLIEAEVLRVHGEAAGRQRVAAALAAVLETPASYAAKQFACRQLAMVATPAEIPALAKLVGAEDPGLAHAGLYALARIPGTEADAAMVEAVELTEGRARLGVVGALGKRRVPAAVKVLAPLLESRDPDLMAEAAMALGRIGTLEAVNALEGAAPPDEEVAGARWMQARLIGADRLVAAGHREEAEAIYRRLQGPGVRPAVRAAALKGWVFLVSTEAAVDAVVDALKSPHREIRTMGAQLAEEIPGEGISRSFARRLGSLPVEAQALLVYALGERRDDAVLQAVSTAAEHSNAEVRLAALGVLGSIGNASTVERLVRHTTASDPAEQEVARTALRRLRGVGIERKLVQILNSVGPAAKTEAILALADRDAREMAAGLMEWIGSGDTEVREAAARAVGELARPGELPALTDMMLRVDARVRSDLRKAIVAAAHRTGRESQTVQRIQGLWRRNLEEAVAGELLAVLGELGHPDGLGLLKQALSDRRAFVRYQAITALSTWPDSAPLDALWKVVENASMRQHRVLALRGAVRMIRKDPKLSADERLRRYEQAMQLALTDATRRLILGELSVVRTPASLAMATSFLDRPQLAQEAAQAAIAISGSLLNQNPQLARNALQRALTLPLSTPLEQQAREALDQIDAMQSYLLNWEVSGPYFQPGKQCTELFDIPFAPENPELQADWRAMPVDFESEHTGYLNLLEALDGGEQRVAYLRSVIPSEDGGPVRLEIWSDDGVKVWLNGKVVHANNTMRPIPADPDVVPVTLNPGTNTLMLKVTQNNLPWGAAVRVRPATADAEATIGDGFRLHVINADSRFEAAGVLDVNRDGRLDIFCGGFWYSSPDWERHFVREVPESGEYHFDFANLPMDVDADGWTDIVNAAFHNATAFWERNPGESGGPWEVIEIDRPGNMETAIAIDINGDGQSDLLPNVGGQNVWYEFRPDTAASHGAFWIKHVLRPDGTGHGNGAGDINGDGRCDVVNPAGWLEQPENPDAPWEWHPEFQLGVTSVPILVHDVNDDGRSDLIYGMGHDYGVFWLEQGRDVEGNREWRRHTIDTEWSQAHFILLADLTGDGRPELVTGKRYRAHNGHDPGGTDPLGVYFYEWLPDADRWERHLIHSGGRVGFGINTAAADMDGDGDTDLVAPGKSGLYLLENQSLHR